MSDATQHPSTSSSETLYLITVWGGVDPALDGPYANEEARLQAAIDFLKENDAGESGVFRLDVDAQGRPSVYCFTNHEIDLD